ncbi:uncharacterized mitochondrial protein AtMg00310-like [Humulus lupulus]|uniref:uncharacterized mitochondrial protein AtMg00310-like n=1 Tax=Humulus lupulus TaxID=3486 RepID=UPI002B40D363|nr:uncharacterized mitochondrial protein AtMg00310-like [Humulus lupulus]
MVIQALPTYAMNVFLLPLSICKDVERMMSRFCWNTFENRRKGISWMSWVRHSSHKTNGEMGFRHLRDFNLALLGKQGWRLLTNENGLVGQIFKARYYPRGTYLSAELRTNPSFIWRSIWEAQELVKKGVQRSVGSGLKIDILKDSWLLNDDNLFVVSNHPGLVNKKVASLLCPGQREWDEEVLNDMVGDKDKDLIMSIPLSSVRDDDLWQWAKEISVVWHGTMKVSYWKLLFVICMEWFEGSIELDKKKGMV